MQNYPMMQSGPYYAYQTSTHFEAIHVDQSKQENGLGDSLENLRGGGSRRERSITAGLDDAQRAGRKRALTFKQARVQQSIQVMPDRKQAAVENKGKGFLPRK